MRILDSEFDATGFFARLPRAPARLLMLDYDGTLAPFREDPAAAVPYPGIPALLDALIADPRTRLVIVSGRWTRDLAPLLGTATLPELWGSHGWERQAPNGETTSEPLPPGTLEALAQVAHWHESVQALGGRVETKPSGIAFHWRELPAERRDAMRSLIGDRWQELDAGHGLCWHDFDGGIELRASGRSKGDVVEELVAAEPEGTVSAYLGDDLTDEDAFRALPRSDAAVLVRPELRPTAARAWIRPPEELVAFLKRWLRD